METNEKVKVRVIVHEDGTCSIPFAAFTIEKPSYNGNPPKMVKFRLSIPVDKESLDFVV